MIGVLTTALLFFAQRVATAETERLLHEDAVRMIVMSTPHAMQLECRHGCPKVELISEGSYRPS